MPMDDSKDIKNDGTTVIKISGYLEVKNYSLDEIRKNLNHHIEYIIDLENNPEIVNVFGVESEIK